MITNWNSIINKVGHEYVIQFVKGNVTRRDFERINSHARALCELNGVDNARRIAARALKHRGHTIK